jgi:hypothetical protein
MKRLVLIWCAALVVFCLAPTVVTADDSVSWTPPELMIARAGAADGSEFVELYNKKTSPITVYQLEIRLRGGTGTLNKSLTFDNGKIAAESSILIAQADLADQQYSGNAIPKSGGYVELWLDGQKLSSVCWGSAVCDNRVAGDWADNKILQNTCLAGGCASEIFVKVDWPVTLNYGGWTAIADDTNDNDDDDTPPTELPTEPENSTPTDNCSLISLSEIGANLDSQFIEIVNLTAEPLDVTGCRLMTNRSSSRYYQFPSLELQTDQYYVVDITTSNLLLTKTTTGTVYVVSSDGMTEYDTVSYQNLVKGNSLALIDGEWQETKWPTSGSANILPPVNLCAELRLSEIGANLDQQFIEVYNPSQQTIDLTGCQLQTNRSQVATFIFPEASLTSHDRKVIFIADTDLKLTKTTTGTVYLLSSDGQSLVDSQSYADLSVNSSWALIANEWLQTYTPTPGAANVFLEFLPCEAGQERNILTGRCRKITSDSTLADCAEGQYRNPLTNRCKKIASDTALAECPDGQYRNPLTNRCKKIADDDDLKPCAEGYERNPETNRCRKIVDDAEAAFAVKPSDGTGGDTWQWLSVATLSFVAIIVAWQYRFEIGRFLAKLRIRRVEAS